MKKQGIFHAQLMREIASLGHFDSFVLCDLGFPIPKGSTIIDLALTRGLPHMRQTLDAILEETVIQEAIYVDAAKEANPALVDYVTKKCKKQTITSVPFPEFREKAKEAKFFVRTGEDAPCSNLMLISASGVLERVEQYRID